VSAAEFWHPSEAVKTASNLVDFMARNGIADYDALVRRADQDPEWFWDAAMKWLDIRFVSPYRKVMDASAGLPWTKWCVGGTTNVVMSCIEKHRGTPTYQKCAIDWAGEQGGRRALTYAELDAMICRIAGALRSLGLSEGDTVALYMPMLPETFAAFLAIAKIGAIAVPLFSGFAAPAVATRLADADVKAVFTVDATWRAGRRVPMKAIVDEALRDVPSVKNVIVLDHAGTKTAMTAGRDHDWTGLVAKFPTEAPTAIVDAEATFLLVYTSGTTGKPKGVVHTHCGFLAKAGADFGLCMDMKSDDRHLWMSDMGWVVGPIVATVTTLLGATIIMAEGAPSWPGDPFRILRLVDEMGVTNLGVAPTLVRQLMAQDPAGMKGIDVSRLRVVPSTGEPWTPDAWDWHLKHICRNRAAPLNVSGGTEISGGILVSTVLHTQRPCGFSAVCPAMGVRILRADGSEAPRGEVGELVFTIPPIGLTRGLWRDPERYIETYWSMFPNVWRHGDWAIEDDNGTWYVHGRSDDTINVAGKRVGPAEIESALLESDDLLDAAAIAAPDPLKGVAVVCVCVAATGVTPDDAMAERLSDVVADRIGKPFRPREVLFVEQLPKTRNMKTMRRVVRSALLDQEPGDLSALVNPEAVDLIRRAARATA
jgi:acetyl-CoA synthetase